MNLVERWRRAHEADDGPYAVLRGFETALRAYDDRLAEWYDKADIEVQLQLFLWVTSLIEDQSNE
jgi:hypothetical protein